MESKVFRDINALMERELPQISKIPVVRRQDWLTKLQEAEAIDHKSYGIQPRPEWHVLRAGGIGSSEVGGVVADLRGEGAWFGGVRSVVAAKLMFDAPPPSTPDTRRGTIMEKMIRSMFLQKLRAQGADVKPRPDLAQVMRHPFYGGPMWLKGNPDDVLEINGTLFIPDYKAPRTTTLAKYRNAESVNFDYEAQLHHLGLRLSYEGLQAHYLLVSLDYDNFDLDIVDIERNPDIVKDIRDGCNMIWNDMILKGHLPELKKQETFDAKTIPAERMLELQYCAKRLAAASGLQKAAKAEMEKARDTIEVLSDSLIMGDKRLLLPGVVINSEMTPDIDQCVKWLSGNGHTEIAEAIAGSPLPEDLARMAEVFAAASTEIPMTEKHSVGLSRARTGEYAEILSGFAEKWNLAIPDMLDKALNDNQVDQPSMKKPSI